MPGFYRDNFHQHAPHWRGRRVIESAPVVTPAPTDSLSPLAPLAPLESSLPPPVPLNTSTVTPPVPALPGDMVPAPPIIPVSGLVNTLGSATPGAGDLLSSYAGGDGNPYAGLSTPSTPTAPAKSSPWLWLAGGALLIVVARRQGWL